MVNHWFHFEFLRTTNLFYVVKNGSKKIQAHHSRDGLAEYGIIRWHPAKKGPTRHAYALQIGPFWQDTLEL